MDDVVFEIKEFEDELMILRRDEKVVFFEIFYSIFEELVEYCIVVVLVVG